MNEIHAKNENESEEELSLFLKYATSILVKLYAFIRKPYSSALHFHKIILVSPLKTWALNNTSFEFSNLRKIQLFFTILL